MIYCIKMKWLIKKIIKYKIVRYSIWWGLAAIIDLLCLRTFTDILWLYYLISAIGAFIISLSFGYIFQKYITFQNLSDKHLLHGWLFLIFQWVGQWLYMGLLWLWVHKLWLYYMYVAFVAKGIVFIRNYISNNYFNFKK